MIAGALMRPPPPYGRDDPSARADAPAPTLNTQANIHADFSGDLMILATGSPLPLVIARRSSSGTQASSRSHVRATLESRRARVPRTKAANAARSESPRPQLVRP